MFCDSLFDFFLGDGGSGNRGVANCVSTNGATTSNLSTSNWFEVQWDLPKFCSIRECVASRRCCHRARIARSCRPQPQMVIADFRRGDASTGRLLRPDRDGKGCMSVVVFLVVLRVANNTHMYIHIYIYIYSNYIYIYISSVPIV